FDELDACLSGLARALDPLREASPGLDACHARAVDAIGRLARWRGGEAPAGPGEDSTAGAAEAAAAAPPQAGEGAAGMICWYELSPRGFRPQRPPLGVAGPLRAPRERSGAAWVFTSATLAVGGQFGHIAGRLGLDRPRTLLAPSPFDWPAQALCYLPQRLPPPASRDYSAAVLDAVLPVLHASGGRAFLLF